jgi:uncharacterized membrane protein
MNTKSSSNKNTVIIGIILVVVLAVGWYFYSKGSSSPSTSQLVSSTPNAATADVGANVLTILNSVSSINIDTNFFSTPTYQSLVDYSIVVPPQAVGRNNPFAPVGQ